MCIRDSFTRWSRQALQQFQSLSNEATLDLSTRLWSMDGSACVMWSKNLRHVVRMMCRAWVVASWYVCGPRHLKCGPSRDQPALAESPGIKVVLMFVCMPTLTVIRTLAYSSICCRWICTIHYLWPWCLHKAGCWASYKAIVIDQPLTKLDGPW